METIPTNIFEIIESGMQRFPNNIALQSKAEGQFSYTTVYELASRLMGTLKKKQLSHQDRVAIVMNNGCALAITMLGTCSYCIAMPLNPEYKEYELSDYLNDLNATLVITDSSSHVVVSVAEKLNIDVMIYDLQQEIIKKQKCTIQYPDHPGSHDVAVILQTSGSTSKPKKAPLTHHNICTSVKDICNNLKLSEQDVCLCMWQQFHIGGLVDLLLVPLATGGKIICLPIISIKDFFDSLIELKPTWFQAVPTTLYETLQYQERNAIDTSNSKLRFIRAVAAQHPPELIKAVETLFDLPVLQTYGMTEASPLITSNGLSPDERKLGSVGKSVGPDIRIQSTDGDVLDIGNIGEILIRGDNIINAYEANQEINDASFKNGWFHTGDTGYLDDDGFLFLTGRIKEQINRGGEKIVPNEIDRIFLEHPAVYQAATFPVPHPTLGEDIAVAIVLHRNWKIDEQEFRDLAAEKLVGFKVPQKIVFVNQIPMNAIGKVNRTGLSQALGLVQINEYQPPNTPMEQSLLEAWKRTLRLEKIGIKDNFFDLGGTSLLGVSLLDEITKELGFDIPIEILYRVSNIEEMAKHLEDVEMQETPAVKKTTTTKTADATFGLKKFGPASDEKRRFMAPIMTSSLARRHSESIVFRKNIDGKKPPLIWCFNAPEREIPAFAECLGSDQPLYGLYSGGGALPLTTQILDLTAGMYIDELLEIVAKQPFFLGGNCRGAMISHKLASSLKENDIKVNGLVLLEYFITPIFDYDDPLFLMFGEQSHFKAYKKFHWGEDGWQKPFAKIPKVSLTPGSHGYFFLQPNITELAKMVTEFMHENT